MKMQTLEIRRGNRCEKGFTLIECLVYIGVMAVVLTIGMTAFYHCWATQRAIRRNAEDVVRALRAGEQWRADVRAATGPIQQDETNAGGETFRIPSSKGDIIYTLVGGELCRKAGRTAPQMPWLPNVKASHMQATPYPGVVGWRWELELNPGKMQTKMRPLFTFETVAGPTTTR